MASAPADDFGFGLVEQPKPETPAPIEVADEEPTIDSTDIGATDVEMAADMDAPACDAEVDEAAETCASDESGEDAADGDADSDTAEADVVEDEEEDDGFGLGLI